MTGDTCLPQHDQAWQIEHRLGFSISTMAIWRRFSSGTRLAVRESADRRPPVFAQMKPIMSACCATKSGR
jgi:hypothetical protein